MVQVWDVLDGSIVSSRNLNTEVSDAFCNSLSAVGSGVVLPV
jgi:hypothetical protein